MSTATPSKWIRVTRHNQCPICGKPDWCLISEDGKIAICARIESHKPVGNKGAGWLHTLDNSMPLPPPKPRLDTKQTLKAMPEVVDKAYHALLAELTLSEMHRDNLRRRGLTYAEIHILGYKTLPANGHCELVNWLQGIRLVGVPGFYVEAGQWQLAGPVGILIPVRDVKRRIAGLQIRCDNVDGGKYKWLSSRGFNAGCSPGAPVHVAGPVSTGGEGLKLGRVVLAVPGGGKWAGRIQRG